MEQLTFLKELQPVYDSANSFYHKANIYSDNAGRLVLISYNTQVAEIIDKTVTADGQPHAKVYDWYSRTTARHINEFLRQHNFNTMTKSQMKGGDDICKNQ